MPNCTRSNTCQSITFQKKLLNDTRHGYFHQLSASSEFKSIVEDNIPIYRDRQFSPTVTLHIFLQQTLSSDKSCEQALMQY